MRHLQHERAAIDLASFRGISSNAIVKRYGLGSHGAIYKHKANHLPRCARTYSPTLTSNIDINLDQFSDSDLESPRATQRLARSASSIVASTPLMAVS